MFLAHVAYVLLKCIATFLASLQNQLQFATVDTTFPWVDGIFILLHERINCVQTNAFVSSLNAYTWSSVVLAESGASELLSLTLETF